MIVSVSSLRFQSIECVVDGYEIWKSSHVVDAIFPGDGFGNIVAIGVHVQKVVPAGVEGIEVCYCVALESAWRGSIIGGSAIRRRTAGRLNRGNRVEIIFVEICSIR